ncbi:uncharacterized protein [Dysidea avara]|uniref:uncharacterized protein isoform X2 n=1 Tax=Dysidea avara TaxID=196820 RepID=UPI00332C48D1
MAMSTFRPPLRKQAENLFDSLEEGDQSSVVSPRPSQEVLSCGFLPPRPQKKTFQPPLREPIQSPGQEFINRILHGEDDRFEEAHPLSPQQFELAPYNPPNTSHENNSDDPDTSKIIRRKQYNYHLGNRVRDKGVNKLAKFQTTVSTTGKKTLGSNRQTDENVSKFKVFEFPLSQGKDDKPKLETKRCESSLVQCVSADICETIRRARQEIREIRERYAAKKTILDFAHRKPYLRNNRYPLKVSVQFLTNYSDKSQPHEATMQDSAKVLSHEE